MRDSGGNFDADLARRLRRIAIKIFDSYLAEMINNQDLTDEQYFGNRLHCTSYLSLGMSKLDLEKDFAAFLYIK